MEAWGDKALEGAGGVVATGSGGIEHDARSRPIADVGSRRSVFMIRMIFVRGRYETSAGQGAKSASIGPPLPDPESCMNLQIVIGPLLALIAGILILIVPRLLNYIVAIYLIVIGLVGLLGSRILG
jgi:hypothetical protein